MLVKPARIPRFFSPDASRLRHLPVHSGIILVRLLHTFAKKLRLTMTPGYTDGLLAAVHTPLHANGELNAAAIPRQAALLREQGVLGAFVCGTTGEGPSLSGAERMAVAEAWKSALPHGRLIVNVGHNSLAEASALARHAAALDVEAIAMHPPCYFRPQSLEALVDCVASVAEHAPRLPLYYYHIPSFTGVRLPMDRYLERALERVPTLRGLKYSDPDLAMLASCLESGSSDVLYGVDEMLLGALATGITGAIGATYNFAAGHHQRLINAFRAGDMHGAQRLSRLSTRLLDILHAHGIIAAGKTAMQLCGLDLGPVRAPLRQVEEPELLLLELRELSILDGQVSVYAP